MKATKSLLALAIIAGAAPSLAADLPYRKAAPYYAPPLPIFTWTGFYIGVNAGGVFDQSSSANVGGDATFSAAAPGNYPTSFRTRDTGFIGGGQIGYNYQMGAFIAGLEADIQGTTLDKTQTLAGTGFTGSFRNSLDYLGTVRGRLGYTPIDRLMLYVTGGLAYGQTNLNYSQVDTGGVTGYSGSHSSLKAGYALGAGAEYAFTQNWSVKAEYLYYDLGKSSVTAFDTALPSSATASQRESGSIARVGLNYKFW